MQVQHEQSQDEMIQALQRQVNELTASNLLLEEKLAQKERFTAVIAHELRGPLSPIITYTQMIARPAPRPEVIERGTKVIISQATRLVRLVDDLLDAAHLSSGQFTLRRAWCDVVELACETIEQARPLAPYHTLVLETSDTSIMGIWDNGRLQQALGNLLDNAIKYSDEHTTITVKVSKEQDVVRFSIHNLGTAIPPTDVGTLFRPFVRLPATRGDRQGSGLGLYITKNIVEAHGGTLRLDPPVAEGQGTTFSFDLPLL